MINFSDKSCEEIQKYKIKCTILHVQYKAVTITTLEFRHVSILSCESSSGKVHQYLYKTYATNKTG